MLANDGHAKELSQVGQHAKMQLNLNAAVTWTGSCQTSLNVLYSKEGFLRIQGLIREDAYTWNAPISITACLHFDGDKSIDTSQWNDTKKQKSILRVPVQNPLPGASSHLHRGALLDWHGEGKVQLLFEPWLQCYQRQSQNTQNVWSSRSWLLL